LCTRGTRWLLTLGYSFAILGRRRNDPSEACRRAAPSCRRLGVCGTPPTLHPQGSLIRGRGRRRSPHSPFA
jgi:hypothetical protein